MGTAEFVGFEPSGRSIVEPDEKTDLDLLLEDFAGKEALVSPEVDLFDFAARFYGEKSVRRRDQTVRGTVKGLKTSFNVQLSETSERLDPPFYLFKAQSAGLLGALQPIGDRIVEVKDRLKVVTDDDKDREFSFASVSSDGIVSLDDIARGEDFSANYKPKVVKPRDFVYNPMRVNIGSIGLVPSSGSDVITSPDYVAFRAEGVDPNFLLSLIRSPFYRMYIDVISTGSIRDRLYFEDLQQIRIPIVTGEEQLRTAEFGRRVDEHSQALLRELKDQRSQLVERMHELVREAAASISATSVAAKFRALAGRWKRETAILSSVSKKVSHPAYKEIVGLGSKAIPLILTELAESPDHWFRALEEISGENPVPKGDRGNVAKAAAAWLNWGTTREFGA